MKKLLTLLIAIALLVTATTISMAEEKTLVVAQTSDTVTLDPQKQGGMASMNVLINLYDTLVTRDENGDLAPCLAKSWEAVNDTTWRFYLRDDVYFHDGDHFDAEDAKFTLDRLNAPETASPIAELKNLDHTDVIDQYTIDLVFKATEPIAPNKCVLFGGVMLSKEYTEAHDADYLALNPNGTGPYKFVSWQKDSEVVMAKNENYWREPAAYDKLIFRVIPNQADMMAALMTGEIDIGPSLTADLAASVSGNESLKVIDADWIRTFFISLDTVNSEPLKDKRVRQALNYAIDKQAIIEAIFAGYAKQVSTILPSQTFGFDPECPYYGYDVEKAKTLLKEAGYENGFEITFDATSGEVMEIQAICGFLEEVGIKINLNVIDTSTMTSLRTSGTAHEMYYIGNTGWTMDGLSNYQSFAARDRRYARGGNEELDALVVKEETTVDPAERFEAFKQAQAIMSDEAFFIFLWQRDNIYVMSTKVDFSPNPIGILNMYTAKPIE